MKLPLQADNLRRLLTFEKLKGTLHDFIYSMDAARIDFLEYQFKPVLTFVNSPTERLLIADEVGLGKTIEAALILLELQARRDARRLLDVCPKMLVPKWRMELRQKFGIQAEIGNVESLRQMLNDIRSEGESCSFAWITGARKVRTPPIGEKS
ncbi:MAG: SNF2-related protein [Verrucomicrobiota bacterium]